MSVQNQNQFTITLGGIDNTNILNLLNRNGNQSNNNITYNLSADNFFNGQSSPADGQSPISVSDVPTATINNTTYQADIRQLTINGTNFINLFGDDINTTNLILLGDNNATFTLGAYSIEITSFTQFSITINNATDLINFSTQIDSNGTQASDGTTYIISTQANWNGQESLASTQTGGSTSTLLVSNIPTATIDSIVFDYPNNVLTITASHLIVIDNPNNSDIATTITLIGEGTQTINSTRTYTFYATANIVGNTTFTISLSNSQDITNIRDLLNKNGNQSNNNTNYDFAVNNNFNGVASVADTASITVSGIPIASVFNASYTFDNNNQASTLTVTGANFIRLAGNDIDTSQLIITGGQNSTNTLVDTYSISIDSSTQFTIALDAIDSQNINNLLNANGQQSITNTEYNLLVNSLWNGDDSVTNNSSITVSGVIAPLVSTATFNYSQNQLRIIGQNFIINEPVSLTFISLIGEGTSTINSTNTYTLSTASSYTVSSSTTIIINLSGNDIQAIRNLLNRAGMASDNNTSYALSVANFWHTNRSPADNNNPIVVSNIPTATIGTTATYNANTNLLSISASNLIKRSGNDIDTTQLQLIGDGGITITLSAYTVEIIPTASLFSFNINNATDLINFSTQIDSNGTQAGDGTTYIINTQANWNGQDSLASNPNKW